jgi:hypothetical protein
MNRVIAFALVTVASVSAGCGGAGESIREPDGVSGATDTPAMGADSGATADPAPLPMCLQPIGGPAEVWPRVEAVRLLAPEQITAECGLRLVELLGRWGCPPVDILSLVVRGAAHDEAALDEWVLETAKASPGLAANVVSADIANAWKVGDDPAGPANRASRWAAAAGTSEEIGRAVAAAGLLAPLLAEVNEMHRLRCSLEVNALGFAVNCKPIHPQGKQIVLSWKTATRDGLLENLEVSSCKGASCKDLRKTAAELKTRYLALMEKVEKLDNEIYREQIKVWLVLPPFTSNT